MRRFLNTIKITTSKSFVSDKNYLTKMSHAHAHNMYNDDDKAISQSLKEQNNNQIKIKVENEWLTSKSEAHAFAGIQDDDTEINKSLNEQNKLFKKEYSNTGC